MKLGDIIQSIPSLSVEQRKKLLILLVNSLTESPHQKRGILEFEGIAAHLADDEDPQDYVRRIRSEWDDRP
jgi:hypothetical protein